MRPLRTSSLILGHSYDRWLDLQGFSSISNARTVVDLIGAWPLLILMWEFTLDFVSKLFFLGGRRRTNPTRLYFRRIGEYNRITIIRRVLQSDWYPMEEMEACHVLGNDIATSMQRLWTLSLQSIYPAVFLWITLQVSFPWHWVAVSSSESYTSTWTDSEASAGAARYTWDPDAGSNAPAMIVWDFGERR